MTELLAELTLNSSGSLATMANAMLDGEFKSSHPDLMSWMEQQQLQQRLSMNQFEPDNDNDDDDNEDDDNNNNDNEPNNPKQTASGGKENSSGGGGGGIMVRANSPSKRSTGDMRSVVIQVPPKRRKLDPSLTVRRLVHGKPGV